MWQVEQTESQLFVAQKAANRAIRTRQDKEVQQKITMRNQQVTPVIHSDHMDSSRAGMCQVTTCGPVTPRGCDLTQCVCVTHLKREMAELAEQQKAAQRKAAQEAVGR